MSVVRRHLALSCAISTTLLALAPDAAVATLNVGPIQLSGNLQSQNLVRSADQESYAFIQNRNTLHLQLDYDWLQAGKFYNKYNIPFLASSHLFIKYRGAYDSIYDTTPGILENQEIPAPAFGWDELRRTFWMFKFLYDLGDVWKFSQNFLEWYWNPGDWAPAKQTFLPRPWGLRFYDPLTNPVDGAFISGPCETSSVEITRGPNKDLHKCTTLMNGTKFLEKGNYNRNPLDNSQVGVRYHGIAPFGLEFSFVYFYQRWAGDDGTNFAPLRGLPKNDKNIALASKLESKGIFPGEYITPYVHSIGMSPNYPDDAYTQTVYRVETIYDVGIPFFDVAKETVIDSPVVPGLTKKNMWKGM